MTHFSWTRVSYIMFAVAVFAALIKLWNPSFSGSESLASEGRPPGDLEPRQTIQASLSQVAGETESVTRKAPGYEKATLERTDYEGEGREWDATDEREKPEADAGSSGGTADGSAAPLREPVDVATAEVTRTPVFYRPAAPDRRDDAPPEEPDAATGPVCGDLGGFPRSSRVVFPLSRDYFYSYGDTWGAPRPQGGHEGTDLMTPAGVPEYAITDGTVVPVSGSNSNGWNSLGGYAVMVRADYDIGPVREGDLFYYAHLEEKSPLEIGDRVRAGQVVGYAGDTGHGPEITRGLFPPHLHLGWYDGRGGRSAVESGAMNPYPLLEWLKRNGGSVAGGSGARYCEALPPDRPNSSGDQPWQPPAVPGPRPDLDTGSDDPRPSPVVKESERSSRESSSGKKNHSSAKARQKPAEVSRPARATSAEPGVRARRAEKADEQRKPSESQRPNPTPVTGEREDRRPAKPSGTDGDRRVTGSQNAEDPRSSTRVPQQDSPDKTSERRERPNPPPEKENTRTGRVPREPPVASEPKKDECRTPTCAEAGDDETGNGGIVEDPGTTRRESRDEPAAPTAPPDEAQQEDPDLPPEETEIERGTDEAGDERTSGETTGAS